MKKTILLVIALMLILTGCNSTSTDAEIEHKGTVLLC